MDKCLYDCTFDHLELAHLHGPGLVSLIRTALSPRMRD